MCKLCNECLKHGVLIQVPAEEECIECYYRQNTTVLTREEIAMEEADRMQAEMTER